MSGKIRPHTAPANDFFRSISSFIFLVGALIFLVPISGQASKSDYGRQQSAIWWAKVLDFHKRVEHDLQEILKRAEQESGTQKGRTAANFKKLLLQASPDARLPMRTGGYLPLPNSTTAYFQNYYHVHRLVQKFPGIVREFNFGRPHMPDITFKDGLNSISVKIDKKDFSSITFTSVSIPAIAPQAREVFKLRPEKITSYEELVSKFIFGNLPEYRYQKNPLPALISDYYLLDPQAASLRIDAFVEKLFNDPAAREKMLNTLEQIYTGAAGKKGQEEKASVPALETVKSATIASNQAQRSTSRAKTNANLPVTGLFILAVISTLAYLRWNDKRSRGLHSEPVSYYEPSVYVPDESTPQPQERLLHWDLDTIRRLPHRQFEILCQRLFEAMGARVQINEGGVADGGIDLKVYKGDKLEVIVQCKQYPRKQIGVNLIREFFGVMTSERAPKGIFITSGSFTESAKDYAERNGVMLADGAALERKLRKHNVLQSSEFTPNAPDEIVCPLCNSSMVWRESGNFWGCSAFASTRCSGKRYKVSAG